MIRTVVTRGYGNGTFSGTIALVVTRGYIAGGAVVGAAGKYRGFIVNVGRMLNR